MDPAITPFAQLLSVNDRLLGKALATVRSEDLARRPAPHSNPLVWVVGHVLATRNLLAKAAGATALELAWAESFGQKSVFDETAAHPSVEELRRVLGELSTQLQARLPLLTDAELSSPAPRRFPAVEPNLRGMIAFLVYHEAYHVGQLGYLMKWLGYPGIVDG